MAVSSMTAFVAVNAVNIITLPPTRALESYASRPDVAAKLYIYRMCTHVKGMHDKKVFITQRLCRK